MVGDNSNKLIEVSELLINSKSYYAKYSKVKQLYGIGKASSKISDFIKKFNLIFYSDKILIMKSKENYTFILV